VLDLSICIVNWNTGAVLRECLRSIYQRTQKISYEIFVVDNASKDGSVEMVRNLFPNVLLIVNKQNRGFAAANNQAIRLAGGRYTLFLNPDTVIHEAALETMVQFMDGHPEAGVVGCKLLNEDGSIQHSIRGPVCFATVLFETTILRRLPLFKRKVRDVKFKRFSFDRMEEVGAVSGAALMVRRVTLNEVGPMDETYFMFMEEVDLCQRVRAKGYKVYYIPDALITHLGGESRNQYPGGMTIIELNSLFRYLTKFEGPKRTFLFKFIFKPSYFLGLISDLFFDSLRLLRYKIVKRDPLKFKKRLTKIKRISHFLRDDLIYFIFKL
jgi:GT2 family glycosyltransferase